MGSLPGADGGGALMIVASYPSLSAANAAAATMRTAGVASDTITIAGGAPPVPMEASDVEAGFLWRLVVIVAVWSMVGAAIGVVMGLIFAAAGVPPGGVAGIGIHIAAWSIFAHLIVGMWAGYALLTRGESRQPVTALASGRVLVRVTTSAPTAESVRALLLEQGALTLGVYGADGRPVPASGA